MKRILLLLLAFAVPFLLAGHTVKRGPANENYSFFEACRAGMKGGGYNKDTGLYDWTCGNFSWSAQVGGTRVSVGDASIISDYNTFTTAGGNSWEMVCTGDGVADQTGAGSTTPDATPVEETVCLHADERIRMYATADIMLAADNTRNNGKIYLPEGLYHLAYCGQQADGTTKNGCPVLQHADDRYIRMVNMWGGRELIGEGQDNDGPHLNGRTGTWFLSAGGDDLDGDGDLDDDICDRNGDGWCSDEQGMLKAGGSGVYTCYRQDGTGGCAVYAAASSPATIPVMHYGRVFTNSVLNEDITQDYTSNTRVCIENRPAVNGICELNRNVRCTIDASGTRLSATTGDCVFDDTAIPGGGSVDLGDCQGLYTALWTDMQAMEAIDSSHPHMLIEMQAWTPDHRGVASGVGATTTQRALAHIGAFDNSNNITGATPVGCATNGYRAYLTASGAVAGNFHPFNLPVFDASAQSATINIPNWDKFNNTEGGFSHLNIMPAHWLGRNSANDAADCDAFGDGGTQDGGTANDACDSNGLLHMGQGWKGHFRYISTWYGGSDGYAKSLVDGTALGYGTELGWSQLNWITGLASDASGWWFHDNIWRGGENAGGLFFNLGYAPGASIERDKFINIYASWLMRFVSAPGIIARDIEVISGNFAGAMFDIGGARQLNISGVRGIGNRGTVFQIAPLPDVDTWDVTVENSSFAGQTTAINTTKPQGLIVRYDNDGHVTYTGGNVDNVTFRDIQFSVPGGNDVCMIFLEGGDGSESAAEHGDARTVDDDRHQLSFEELSIERETASTITSHTEFFCLGNAHADEQTPGEAMTLVPGGIFAAKGGLPRWTNLCVDGMCYPDNPYRSMRAVDADLDATADIDDGTEKITFTGHGLRDRDVVTYTNTGGNDAGGLADAGVYYVIYVDKDTIQLDDDRSIAAALDLTDAVGTFTLTTGLEPDCDELGQGTVIRTHSATAEGACTDADTDGLLDGGGDFNALCVCGG